MTKKEEKLRKLTLAQETIDYRDIYNHVSYRFCKLRNSLYLVLLLPSGDKHLFKIRKEALNYIQEDATKNNIDIAPVERNRIYINNAKTFAVNVRDAFNDNSYVNITWTNNPEHIKFTDDKHYFVSMKSDKFQSFYLKEDAQNYIKKLQNEAILEFKEEE